MKAVVVGAGYVGAVTAAGLAAVGHDVSVHDLDAERVRTLVGGAPRIAEPGLAELVRQGKGRLQAAASLADALHGADVCLVCVGTPSGESGLIDLGQVRSSMRAIAETFGGTSLVVAIRSTVVPGTTDELDREFFAPLRSRRRRISAAANPEFLREGRAVRDFMEPDRVVVGVSDPATLDTLRRLYAYAGDRLMVMSTASAELAKYANNALLAMLISFSNELAEIAEQVEGGDVIDALRSVHADRRWREATGTWAPDILSYLWPGCGYGGSCLPKDVKALAAAAERWDVPTPLLRAVDTTNERQAERLADRIAGKVPLRDATVAVLGTAFKERTDDTRDSPGLAVALALRARGARVVLFDPIRHDPGNAPDLETAIGGSTVWVVVTGAHEFQDLRQRAAASGALLVDARRRFLDPGGHYLGPGRP